METLYRRFRMKDGSKRYLPTVRGRHHRKLFKRAREAQAFSLRLRDRHQRLKKAQAAAHDL